MSGGCCGQAASGFVHVWQLRGATEDGKPVECNTQSDALAAQREHGGRGTILRVTKRVT